MSVWRKWHKWIGMIVGIQVILWLAGGLLMSAIPIDMVRGQHMLHERVSPPFNQRIVEDSVRLSDVKAVRWALRDDVWVLRATDWQDQVSYIDAATGEVLPALSKQRISDIASARLRSEATVLSVQYLTELPAEVANLNAPLYRVDFDDALNSSLYLDPVTGKVIRVRTDIWRLYDFFWMLHIMDYQHRKDFNNPLLITAAIAALLLSASGIGLLFFAVIRPQSRKLLYYLRKA